MTSHHPLAGHPLPKDQLIDVEALIDAYYSIVPDADEATQRVSFGTSGHRGTSIKGSFNENHILAMSQAIADYRRHMGISGPLFMGIDTHALSAPAQATALEVLAANGIHVFIADDGGFTPTPVISHAILTANRGKTSGLADGIVITPSHNPPADGGFKYNPPHGGPADTDVTAWIQARANEYLRDINAIKRFTAQQQLSAGTVKSFDYLAHYVNDLDRVIDFERIRQSGLRLGVDPLGGAGIEFWSRIAEVYQLNLTLVNDKIDPQFGFMTADWDGKIRMDPSSRFAMQSLLGLKDQFDIAFACDPDHDRHGIVTRSTGLMLPNHYLSVAIDYLYQSRPNWPASVRVGKTLVSSAMIDRVARQLGRELYEVPVGFKWFSQGLLDGSLGFGGEESAGASFLDKHGDVWTTDKDGLIPALLAAEMTAADGRDPGARHRDLIQHLGGSVEIRVDAPLSAAQKAGFSRLTPASITAISIAGEPILAVRDRAPGNDAAIGGIKVETANGWFAARPSGTEPIYKIYAESFNGQDHLETLVEEAKTLVDQALGS